MSIIDILNERKQYMPDLQLKEISFGLNKLYIINIQTVSDSSQSNKFILDYLAKRSLLKNEIVSSLKKDIINYIPSISFIEINASQVFEYLFNTAILPFCITTNKRCKFGLYAILTGSNIKCLE